MIYTAKEVAVRLGFKPDMNMYIWKKAIKYGIGKQLGRRYFTEKDIINLKQYV